VAVVDPAALQKLKATLADLAAALALMDPPFLLPLVF
jgi:hypothetical protein